ncbi:MAG: tRNA adenosine(34) deaminase TadA [Candidatus Omnitrophota bacterium]
MKTEETHNLFMRQALKEAQKAVDADEVPVGCVIVYEDKIIARAHNQMKLLKDPTAHAEMIALTQAAAFLQSERLIDVRIYVTIEPCTMCAGAMVLARVKELCFGAKDPKTGACGSLYNIVDDKRLNHHIKVINGLLEKECGLILSEFFKGKRAGH